MFQASLADSRLRRRRAAHAEQAALRWNSGVGATGIELTDCASCPRPLPGECSWGCSRALRGTGRFAGIPWSQPLLDSHGLALRRVSFHRLVHAPISKGAVRFPVARPGAAGSTRRGTTLHSQHPQSDVPFSSTLRPIRYWPFGVIRACVGSRSAVLISMVVIRGLGGGAGHRQSRA